MEGKDYWEEQVRVVITARRVRIDPDKKRRQYIRRLEKLMRQCDRIINDPEGFEEIQVKAMAILIRAIDLCYGIVRDVDIEELKRELRQLEEENRRAKERAGFQDPGSRARMMNRITISSGVWSPQKILSLFSVMINTL